MGLNSPSAKYEVDASKTETRWAYGGSSLRIQIHFWTQRIMRCMGESVDGWSGEDSCVSSPKRYKSRKDTHGWWEDCASSRWYTSSEDSCWSFKRYRASEDVSPSSSEDTYRPSVRRYRSSEDVTTSWED